MVSHQDNNAQRIVALDRRAEALGLKPGMGLADARAMHPAIDVVEMDADADRRLLDALADWCDRYTPLVALDGEDGLFLDITGCSHLFGGEEALVAETVRHFADQGFDARAALADTAGAAWAVARFHGNAVVPGAAQADWLVPLPLAALRLDHTVCTGLESVGLRTVGAIMSAPRAPLARRFGKALMLRLDQALGRIEEALSPRLAVPELSAERRLFEPIATTQDIERMILLLVVSLQAALEQREAGALGLQLMLFRVDGDLARLKVGLSRPSRSPARIARLFHERLAALADGLDAGCGFDLVRLSVLSSAALPPHQVDLADDADDAAADLASFVDRVGARFGRGAVCRPAAVASHVPERAVAFLPFAESAGSQTTPGEPLAGDPSCSRERPLRLLRQPEPVEVMAEVPEGPPLNFLWRRAQYRITRAEGPERIGPEWWLDAPPDVEKEESEDSQAYEQRRGRVAASRAARLTRDYFRVEDGEGRRYWLYRQGLYGHSEASPRWFLHGIFA